MDSGLEFSELGGAGSSDDSGLSYHHRVSLSSLTGSTMSGALSPGDSRKQSIQRCTQSLVHACYCRDANCLMQSCLRLKRIVQHSRNCRRRQIGQAQCPICRQLIALCCYHSKTCEDTQNKCLVPFCSNIKGRLKQQQVQTRMVQHELVQNRIGFMTNTLDESATSSPPTVLNAVAPQTTLTEPKCITSNMQQTSLNIAPNNISQGTSIAMIPAGISQSGATIAMPDLALMNHVHVNSCCDSPSPPDDSMQYISKQPGDKIDIQQLAPMMQQQIVAEQCLLPHEMPQQGSHIQQQTVQHTVVNQWPQMMHHTIPGPCMMDYQSAPQSQQLTTQPQQSEYDQAATYGQYQSPNAVPVISAAVISYVKTPKEEEFIDMRPPHGTVQNMSQDWLDTICRHLIEHMELFGICVIDNFLGSLKGESILREVKQLYNNGQYTRGKLVSNKSSAFNGSRPGANSNSTIDTTGVIRNDRVIWIDGFEEGCSEINNLIQTLCSVITNGSRLSLYSNNGLDKIVINKRTKAHVACYPGNGTRYIKHVDNPNGDGRVITSIYYLNKDWNTERDGGLLRMFPAGIDEVANIEPLFDRALFFWSDRRNPHEVLPAYKDRFAITVWYIGESRPPGT